MAFCKNCGKQLEEDEKFCGGCGKATTAETVEQKAETVKPSSDTVVGVENKSENCGAAVTSIWQGYVSFWKNYANFKGRATRMEFWGAFLINFIIIIGIVIIAMVFTVAEVTLAGNVLLVLSCIYTLAVSIPNTTITIRRLHDVNRSARSLFWGFTIIGSIPIFIWLCEKSWWTPDNETSFSFKDDKKASVVIIVLFAIFSLYSGVVQITLMRQIASLSVVDADFYERYLNENRVQLLSNDEGEYEGEGEHSMYDENGNLKTK